MLTRRHILTASAGTVAWASLRCAGVRPSPPPDQRYPSLTGFCDEARALGADDYAAHVKKIQAGLRAAGLSALIVEPGATMRYVSGVEWWPSERTFVAVIPADAAPWWVSPAFEADRARERVGDQAEIRLWEEHEDPFALLAKGLTPGRIAVDPGMRHFIYAGIARSVAPREVISGRSVVTQARMIKSDRELALLDRANQATKAALQVAYAQSKIGMRESSLRRIIRDAQAAAGLKNVWALVLFGPNAAFPHGTGKERTLQAGDMVLVDTGGQLHGYCSDITRTWSVGPVSDAARRAYDTVLTAQRAAFDMLRPGVRCEDVDAVARQVIEKAGYGAQYTTFTHRLGHGIGLQGHEDPYLVRGNDLVLAPGMTMSNEPGIYQRGKLGVRIEDIVAITEDGHRIFGPTVRSFDEPI